MADRPSDLMGSVTKRWNKIDRRLQRERSSTLDPIRRLVLEREISYILTVTFATKPELLRENRSVLFIAPGDLARVSTQFDSLYVTVKLGEVELQRLLKRLRRDGLAVIYD